MKVRFNNIQFRELFFQELKGKFGQWNNLANYLKVNRNTILKYKTGKNLMNLDTFNELKKFTNLKDLDTKINLIDDNWGSKLGGNITYKKHRWIFDSGRNKLLNKHKKTDDQILDLNVNSKELAEFIGILIGDGFIGKYNRSRMIQITGNKINDRDYYLNFLSPLMLRLFKVQPHFYDHKTCIRLNIYSKVIFNTLNRVFEFPIGKKHNLQIPQVFLKNKGCKIAVVRGIFDTDGGIHISKRNYPMIVISTTSNILAYQIEDILKDLNFKVNTYINKKNPKAKKPCYRITMYGKENILKWKTLIGASNPFHIKKLNNATVAQIV